MQLTVLKDNKAAFCAHLFIGNVRVCVSVGRRHNYEPFLILTQLDGVFKCILPPWSFGNVAVCSFLMLFDLQPQGDAVQLQIISRAQFSGNRLNC